MTGALVADFAVQVEHRQGGGDKQAELGGAGEDLKSGGMGNAVRSRSGWLRCWYQLDGSRTETVVPLDVRVSSSTCQVAHAKEARVKSSTCQK